MPLPESAATAPPSTDAAFASEAPTSTAACIADSALGGGGSVGAVG